MLNLRKNSSETKSARHPLTVIAVDVKGVLKNVGYKIVVCYFGFFLHSTYNLLKFSKNKSFIKKAKLK